MKKLQMQVQSKRMLQNQSWWMYGRKGRVMQVKEYYRRHHKMYLDLIGLSKEREKEVQYIKIENSDKNPMEIGRMTGARNGETTRKGFFQTL